MSTPVWPVVGRDREIAAIRAALQGSRGGVLLCGEAGVGKTALARHVIDETDTGVYWTVASASAREIPLGPFAALLGRPDDDSVIMSSHIPRSFVLV